MDDVHIGVMDQIPPIMIGLELGAKPFLSFLESVVKVLLVNIADSHETAALVTDKMEVTHSDSSNSDDTPGHLVARSDELAGRVSHLAEYLTGKYRQGA